MSYIKWNKEEFKLLIKDKELWLQENGMYKCPICSKESSKFGINNHLRQAHFGYPYPKPSRCLGKIPWNKGLTKETDDRLKQSGINISKRVKGKKTGPLSEEHRKNISIGAKNGKTGGYRAGSGRGRAGWYKDIFCDSSWELAYLIYCLDHNIGIKRNTQKFEYIHNNEVHNYTPDFLVNGELVEIKGYITDKWRAKLATNLNIKVYYQKEIQPILIYVIEKYGNNFTDLYEKKSNKLLAFEEKKKTVKKVKEKKTVKKVKENINQIMKAKEKINREINKCHVVALKVNQLIDSDIDFTTFGWVGKASKIIGITPQKTRKWIERNYPKLLDNCYKRNKIVKHKYAADAGVGSLNGLENRGV